MDTDEGILKTIALINQKIQTLEGLRDQLLTEFGIKNGQRSSVQEQPPATEPALPLPEGQPQTRKQEVAALLRQSGPLRRSEIIKRSGLPAGTVAYCLNDEKLFRRRSGRWDVAQKDSA